MAAIATASIGIASSGYQIAKSAADKKKAQKELDALGVPEISNAFEDIQISQIGSDLLREENQIANANAVDASQAGGVRGVMGNIPKIVGMTNDANKEARKYLDDQAIERDYAIAGDDRRVQGVTEQRYMGDVQGLNNSMQGAEQNMWSGIRGAYAGFGALGRATDPNNEAWGVTGAMEGDRRTNQQGFVEVFNNGRWESIPNKM